MARSIVYIDGFNLYKGLDDKGWRRYLWLDLGALARAVIGDGDELVEAKYFTARVGRPEASMRRQSTFLDALSTCPGLTIIYGKCTYGPESCRECNHTWDRRQEKKTDVGIAVHMLRDAYEDAFDTAVLISGDTDLVPVVEMIKRDHAPKRVAIASPPKRVTAELNKAATTYSKIEEEVFRSCQFPQLVQTGNYTVCCPTEWWNEKPDSN